MSVTYEDLKARAFANTNPRLAFKEFNEFFDKEYRYVLSDRMRTLMDNKGLMPVNLRSLTGIDSASITRALKKNREDPRAGFRLSSEDTLKLATLCFEMSCHEFATGEIIPSRLPRELSVVAEIIESQASEKAGDAIYKDVLNAVASTKQNDGQNQLSFSDLFVERYREMCRENESDYSYPVGGVKMSSAARLMNFPAELFRDGYEYCNRRKARFSKFPVLIYMSTVTETPIDYFVAQNYAKFLPVKYRVSTPAGAAEEEREVRSPAGKKTVELLLKCNGETRERVISDIISEYWTAGAN